MPLKVNQFPKDIFPVKLLIKFSLPLFMLLINSKFIRILGILLATYFPRSCLYFAKTKNQSVKI